MSPVTTAVQAVAYALDLEQACLAAWRFVVVRGGDGTDVGGLKATAVDGARLGYRVAVPLAATRYVALSSDDDVAAREEMAAAGVALV